MSDGVLDQLTYGRLVTDPTTIATMENVQLCKRRSQKAYDLNFVSKPVNSCAHCMQQTWINKGITRVLKKGPN